VHDLDRARVRADAAHAAAAHAAEADAAEEIRPVINVIVRELAPLERYLPGGIDEVDAQLAARVRRLRPERDVPPQADEDLPGEEVGSSMRAVAPPIQSFASGRRR
jgi:hypothetical protein